MPATSNLVGSSRDLFVILPSSKHLFLQGGKEDQICEACRLSKSICQKVRPLAVSSLTVEKLTLLTVPYRESSTEGVRKATRTRGRRS